MKISPVQGTPTIQNPSATGLSPEKLIRIKQIASNQSPTEEVETPKEEVNLGAIALSETPTSKTQSIKMSVNKTPNEIFAAPIVEENAPPAAPEAPKVEETPVAISDPNVQAQPTPGVTKAVSPELAQLAKERRALQLEREKLAEEKKALEAKPQGGEFISIQDLKSAPLSVLLKHGVTYEQLTNEILGQQSQQPSLDLQSFKDEVLKTIDEKLAGKDSAQEEAVYNYMRQEVDKMSNLQPYRFIREEKAQDKVMELIKRSWREKGEILTEEEAMNLIESELREDAKRYAKLIGEMDVPKTPLETPVEEPKEAPKAVVKPKTLTNKDSARPVMSRRQRAIAAALGQK